MLRSQIGETIRTHHEGTKNTKGLANILLNFVTFVVSPLFFAPFAFFAVKCLLWLRLCRTGLFVVNSS
jgi:hypothetical protein